MSLSLSTLLFYSGTDYTFQWTSVPDAVQYRFTLKDQNGSVLKSKKVNALTYTLSIPDGVCGTWSVEALDNSGNVLEKADSADGDYGGYIYFTQTSEKNNKYKIRSFNDEYSVVQTGSNDQDSYSSFTGKVVPGSSYSVSGTTFLSSTKLNYTVSSDTFLLFNNELYEKTDNTFLFRTAVPDNSYSSSSGFSADAENIFFFGNSVYQYSNGTLSTIRQVDDSEAVLYFDSSRLVSDSAVYTVTDSSLLKTAEYQFEGWSYELAASDKFIAQFSDSTLSSFRITVDGQVTALPDICLNEGSLWNFKIDTLMLKNNRLLLSVDGSLYDYDKDLLLIYEFDGTQWEQIYSRDETGTDYSYAWIDDCTVNTMSEYGAISVITLPEPVEPEYQMSGDQNGLMWEKVSGSEEYRIAYSADQLKTGLWLDVKANALDTYGVPQGNWQWKVKADNESDWHIGNAFTATEKTGESHFFHSDSDGISDLFFVSPCGQWMSGYAAQHAGSIQDWQGTGEQVSLDGKNKISDIFEGSGDANILILTDDDNGDALFVDDIYSAFPSEQRSRLAQIDEIRAGSGDDIVDMTSQQFEYTGEGLTIRGGDGNDVIWANKGSNLLFGDAGNDRIVGASGNDVIAGGSGDDSMHGGGGNDIFCFCNDFGTDTVEQLASGNVTLWFVSGSSARWDAASLRYTDGTNSVQVSGITANHVTLKFGDDGSAEYQRLCAAGAFLSNTTDKIFTAAETGIIAVL